MGGISSTKKATHCQQEVNHGMAGLMAIFQDYGASDSIYVKVRRVQRRQNQRMGVLGI